MLGDEVLRRAVMERDLEEEYITECCGGLDTW